MTSSNSRQSEFPIEKLFLDRWSPRAFDDTPLPEQHLLTILEAAHWAPSAFNHQPWRFVYAIRGSAQWDAFSSLLVEFNQSWAKTAGALVFIVSRTQSGEIGAADQKANYSHSFDAGAAWGALALQAQLLGYQAHGMTGIQFDKAYEAFGISSSDFRIEAAAAIGKIGDKQQLPEGLRERELPSSRKPLSEVAFNGTFVAK